MFRLTNNLWTGRRSSLAKPARGSRFTEAYTGRPTMDWQLPSPDETPYQARRRRRRARRAA